ncbi:MAG: hypothetical protein L7S57_04625 [Luminiphilus sp.]|nr:hypothetical protein [Luminiphilus sp.]
MNRHLYPGVLEELERAHREKLEMDALVAQHGGMSAVEPSWRDTAQGVLADGLQAAGFYEGNDYAARRTADGLLFVNDFTPAGMAAAAADSQEEFSAGNPGMGALYAVGAIPGLGKGASLAADGIKYARAAKIAEEQKAKATEAWDALSASTERVGKRNKDGSYVGGPKGVKSPQKRASVVNNYVERVDNSLNAGIEPGYFYGAGARALADVTDNAADHRMVAEMYGPTSTQVGPYQNTLFTLKALDQNAVGAEINTGMYPNSMRENLELNLNGVHPHQGYKVSRYSYNLGPQRLDVNDLETMPPNDQWEGLGVGWDSQHVPSGPAQVAYADDIRARAAEKINTRRAANGEAPLTLPEVQELHWAAIRAEMEGRPLVLNKKDTVQGSLGDFRIQHAWEAEPGAKAGMYRTGIGADEYNDQVLGVLKDDQGKDNLNRAFGARMQAPIVQGSGVWEGSLNPSNQSISYGAATKSKGIDPATAARVDGTEATRQFMLGQEGRAYSMMGDSSSIKGRNMADFKTGAPPTPDEHIELQSMVGDAGTVTPTEDGYRVIWFNDNDGKAFTEAMAGMPGEARFGKNFGEYNELDWEGGNATKQLLSVYDDLPPGVLASADSGPTREIAGKIAKVYEELSEAGQLKANQKLTEALKVWEREGIAGLRKMVAQGTAPVALLAILASQDEGQGALSA